MGMTLRGFRLHLRLAVVLDRLADGADDLTALAVRSGFADYAHMTNSFHRAFGMPPSKARALLAGRGLRAMRKTIQARAGVAG
jgi:transcriptional regulator GlxA family with amidase domain